MKFRKLLLFPVLLLVFLSAVAVGGLFWWSQNSKPVSMSKETIDFLVIRGRSASEIGQALYKEGLIKSSLAFKFYVQLTGKQDQIRAGEFRLSPSLSLEKIVDTLSGPPLELWVTVPEGLRREEIVEKFIDGLEKQGSEAIGFRREFLEESISLEGYLFPDTYLFPRDVKASSVVSALRNTFDKKMREIGSKYPAGYGLDDIVVLASLIEREAITNEERPVIAGILYNRLEKDWPLQVDAAVQYAIANDNCAGKVECEWWPKNLTREDLEISSPFNTYQYPGIPPSPISNPGFESLKAAANPTSSDYYFYIHADGKIYYAKTLAEHNANVRKYLGK
jgi:UPF0755 protein